MKIFCVGRNYVDHAKELNNPLPQQPVVFTKPPTAVIRNGQDFYIPDFSKNVHYEGELVIRIGKNGKNIAEKFAQKYVDAITFGLDFTARDLQDYLKENKLPWDLARASTARRRWAIGCPSTSSRTCTISVSAPCSMAKPCKTAIAA